MKQNFLSKLAGCFSIISASLLVLYLLVNYFRNEFPSLGNIIPIKLVKQAKEHHLTRNFLIVMLLLFIILPS
jgi:hypothetical protein